MEAWQVALLFCFMIIASNAQADDVLPHPACRNLLTNVTFYRVECPRQGNLLYEINKDLVLSSIHPLAFYLEIHGAYIISKASLPPLEHLVSVKLINFNREEKRPRFSIAEFFRKVNSLLRKLELNNVKIKYFDKDDFRGFSSLKELLLTSVFVEDIGPDVFQQIAPLSPPNKYVISMQWNRLKSLDWSFLKPIARNVGILILSDQTLFSDINWTCSDSTFRLTGLTKVDFSLNKIESFPACVLGTLPRALSPVLGEGFEPDAVTVAASTYTVPSMLVTFRTTSDTDHDAKPVTDKATKATASSLTTLFVTPTVIDNGQTVMRNSTAPTHALIIAHYSASDSSPSIDVLAVTAGSVAGIFVLISAVMFLLFRNRILSRCRAECRVQTSHSFLWPNKVHAFMQWEDSGPMSSATFAKYTQLLNVSPNELHISGEILGSGAFGTVYKATASTLPMTARREITVAAKTFSDPHNKEQERLFAEEVKVMLKCGRHVNIVNLLGIVSKGQPFLIIEYCQHGSFRSFLRNRRGGGLYSHIDDAGALLPFDQAAMEKQCQKYHSDLPNEAGPSRSFMLSTIDLFRFCHQIAQGAQYLSSRHIIHRDLAARNVLVSDKYILKIADFGLARHDAVSYMISNVATALPVLWMSPDSILTRTFSQMTDVWSYGVLLWEIFSLGDDPFGGPEVVKLSANGFAEWLLEGHQMSRPVYATKKMYEMMQSCWCLVSEDRPTFTTIVQSLDDILCKDFTHSPYLCLDQESDALPELGEMNLTYISLDAVVKSSLKEFCP
ncbi:Fibroblast growth factor receptor-like protein 2 [Hypsibius exemplaris]|uniref:Fibroblast growth factor receptor-like protein 2 n=1 Tax=Hypsibius exemplaris TaxID=2072580 RepID=A0A1W0WKQ8_HYPEX|nr:Fibroblast growth factor receptor-like protein 2 [Hypsibius exemplaris]